MLEGSSPPLCHWGQRNVFNPLALLRDTGSPLEAALVTRERGRGGGVVMGEHSPVLLLLLNQVPHEDFWRTEH